MSNSYSVVGNTLTVTIADGPAAGTYSANIWGMMIIDVKGERVVRMGTQTVGGTRRDLMVRVSTLPGVKEAIEQSPIMLISEREAITDKIASAMQESIGIINDAHETESSAHFNGRASAKSAEYVRDAETARVELAAFDAAHPEIVAEINAERAAATKRATWN